jgi:tRNA A-37 threonylcarbamoyl transferase component Bud32
VSEGPTRSVDGLAAADASTPRDASATPAGAPGDIVGRYVIESTLGAGGMGVVYLARDPELGRHVAIKQLPPRASSWQAEARLLREAQAMARLAHPNVVAVYDVGLSERGPFVAMEYVDGTTLRAWCEARPRSPAEILAHYIAAGEGLEAAHRAGLVHRDFKPDNVLVDRHGRARVTDFGIARHYDDDPDDGEARPGPVVVGVTAASRVVGTPGYMSPEQYRRAALDHRSDQFSFACALFEALAGRLPFAGVGDALRAAVQGGELRARELERVPAWLRAVLSRALASDPAERYPSMAALVAALRADPTRRRRRRRIALAAALAVGLGGGAVAVGAIGGDAASEPSAAACAAPSPMAAVWNPTRAAAVEAAVGERERVWTDLDGTLDRYALDWTAAHVGACLAAARGELPSAEAATRGACLDERLAAFTAVVDDATAGARDAWSLYLAARRLPPIAPCGGSSRAPATDPNASALLVALVIDAATHHPSLEVVDTRSMTLVARSGVGGARAGDEVRGLVASADLDTVYVELAGADGYHVLAAVEPLTGELAATVPVEARPGFGELVLSPLGSALYATAVTPGGDGARLLAAAIAGTGPDRGDLVDAVEVALPPEAEPARSAASALAEPPAVAVSRSGRRLVVATATTVHVYATRVGELAPALLASAPLPECATPGPTDLVFANEERLYVWRPTCGALVPIALSLDGTPTLHAAMSMATPGPAMPSPAAVLAYFHSHVYARVGGALWMGTLETGGSQDMHVRGEAVAIARNPMADALYIATRDGVGAGVAEAGDRLSRITSYKTANDLYVFGGRVAALTMAP